MCVPVGDAATTTSERRRRRRRRRGRRPSASSLAADEGREEGQKKNRPPPRTSFSRTYIKTESQTHLMRSPAPPGKRGRIMREAEAWRKGANAQGTENAGCGSLLPAQKKAKGGVYCLGLTSFFRALAFSAQQRVSTQHKWSQRPLRRLGQAFLPQTGLSG